MLHEAGCTSTTAHGVLHPLKKLGLGDPFLCHCTEKDQPCFVSSNSLRFLTRKTFPFPQGIGFRIFAEKPRFAEQTGQTSPSRFATSRPRWDLSSRPKRFIPNMPPSEPGITTPRFLNFTHNPPSSISPTKTQAAGRSAYLLRRMPS